MTTPQIPQHSDKQPEHTSIIETEIPSIFTHFELYLFGQGKHYHLYEKMGAHLRTINGVTGINFAVWAPNALTVSVIGDF
ncbi:MAG TPA: 1,4-alpha-glucan branching enzyme, partial [Ktedonobacteraceae bacterium]